MKSITLFLGLIFLLCINSFGQNFQKLADSEVDAAKIEIAKKFASDYMTKQKDNSYYQFKDEAIDAVKNQLTEERQKTIYKQIKNNFGDFESLEYAETWIHKGDADYRIYRFKADFEKSTKKLEIRVVLNESDKITGFWIRPWSDVLN